MLFYVVNISKVKMINSYGDEWNYLGRLRKVIDWELMLRWVFISERGSGN